MATDPRIPGVQLKDGENVDMILKWHGIVYFKLIHLLTLGIALIVTVLKARNALMVITNQRVIIQSGVISKEQTKIDLLKIQDISCGVKGILNRIAGAGYVHIETAGRSSGIRFEPVANYQSIVDKIGELVDGAKKQEQIEMARNIAKGMKGDTDS